MKISSIFINVWCVFVCIENISTKTLTKTSENKEDLDNTTTDQELEIGNGILDKLKEDHGLEELEFEKVQGQNKNENNITDLGDEKTTNYFKRKINKQNDDEHEGENIRSEIHDVDLTRDFERLNISESNEQIEKFALVNRNGDSKNLTIETGEGFDPAVIRTKLYNDEEEDEENEDENDEKGESVDSNDKLSEYETEENLRKIHKQLVRALPYISFDRYRGMNKTDNINDLDIEETTVTPDDVIITVDLPTVSPYLQNDGQHNNPKKDIIEHVDIEETNDKNVDDSMSTSTHDKKLKHKTDITELRNNVMKHNYLYDEADNVQSNDEADDGDNKDYILTSPHADFNTENDSSKDATTYSYNDEQKQEIVKLKPGIDSLQSDKSSNTETEQTTKDKIMDISDHSKSVSKLSFSVNAKNMFDDENHRIHNSKSESRSLDVQPVLRENIPRDADISTASKDGHVYISKPISSLTSNINTGNSFDTVMEDSHNEDEKDDEDNDETLNMSTNYDSIGSLKDVRFSSNLKSLGNPSSIQKTHHSPVTNRGHFESSSWLDTNDLLDDTQTGNRRHSLDTDESAFEEFKVFPKYKHPVFVYPYPSDKPKPIFDQIYDIINTQKSFDAEIEEKHKHFDERSESGDHRINMSTNSNARLEEVRDPSKSASINPSINAESNRGSTITQQVNNGHVLLNGKMSLTNYNKQLYIMPHNTENVDNVQDLPVKDVSILNHIPPQNPVIVPPLYSTDNKVLHISDNQQHILALPLNTHKSLDQENEGVHNKHRENNDDDDEDADDDDDDNNENDVNMKMSSNDVLYNPPFNMDVATTLASTTVPLNIDRTTDDQKDITGRQHTASIVSSVYPIQNQTNIKESKNNDNLITISPLTDSAQYLIMSQLNTPNVAKPLYTLTDKVSNDLEPMSVVPSDRDVHIAMDADSLELHDHDNDGDDDDEDGLYKPTPIASVGPLKNMKISMNFASISPPLTRERIEKNLPTTQEETTIASGGIQNREKVDHLDIFPNIENQLSSAADNDMHMSKLLNPSSLLPDLINVEANTEPQIEEDRSSENDNAETDMSMNFASVDPSVKVEKIKDESDPLSGHIFSPMDKNKQNIFSHAVISANDGHEDEDDDDESSQMDYHNIKEGITWLGSSLHGAQADSSASDFSLSSPGNTVDENKDEDIADYVNVTDFPNLSIDEELNDDMHMPQDELSDREYETKKDNGSHDYDWLMDLDMGTFGLHPPPASIQQPEGITKTELVPLLDILDDVVNSKMSSVEDTDSKNEKVHDENYWKNRKYIEELVAEFPEMYEISNILNTDDTVEGDSGGKLKSLIKNQAISQLNAKNDNDKNELSDESEEEQYIGIDNDAQHGESDGESVIGEKPGISYSDVLNRGVKYLGGETGTYNDELRREHNVVNAKYVRYKPNSSKEINDMDSTASNEQGLFANSARDAVDEESESVEENYIGDNDHTEELESEELHRGSDSDAHHGESASHELNMKTSRNKPYKGFYGPEHYTKSAGYRIDRKTVSTEQHANSDSDALDEEIDSHEITSVSSKIQHEIYDNNSIHKKGSASNEYGVKSAAGKYTVSDSDAHSGESVSHEINAVPHKNKFYLNEESDANSAASASYETSGEFENYDGADNDAHGGESASHEITALPQGITFHVGSNSDSKSANSGSYETQGISKSVGGYHTDSDNDALSLEAASQELKPVSHNNKPYGGSESDLNSDESFSKGISMESKSGAGSDNDAHNRESVSHEINVVPHMKKFYEHEDSDANSIVSFSNEISGESESIEYHAGSDNDAHNGESASHEITDLSHEYKFNEGLSGNSKSANSGSHEIKGTFTNVREYHIDSDALSLESASHEIKPISQNNTRYGGSESDAKSIEAASIGTSKGSESGEYRTGSDSDAKSGESVSHEVYTHKFIAESESNSKSVESTSYELNGEFESAEYHGGGSDSDAHSGESVSHDISVESNTNKLQKSKGDSKSAQSTSYGVSKESASGLYPADSNSDSISEESRSYELSGESESSEYRAGSASDAHSGESESAEYHTGSDSDAHSGESTSHEINVILHRNKHSGSSSNSHSSKSAEGYSRTSGSNEISEESETNEQHAEYDSDAHSGESESAEYHTGSDSDAHSGESSSHEINVILNRNKHRGSSSNSHSSESVEEYSRNSGSNELSVESESNEQHAEYDSDAHSGESESAEYHTGSDSDAHSGESTSHEINVILHRNKHRGSSSNSHSSESVEEYSRNSGSNELSVESESNEQHAEYDSDAHSGESASNEFNLEQTNVKNHESGVSSYENSGKSTSDELNDGRHSEESASNELSIGIRTSDDLLSRELIQRKSASEEMDDESVSDVHNLVADTHFEVPSNGNEEESLDNVLHPVTNIVDNSTEDDDKVSTTTIYKGESNPRGQPDNPDDKPKEKTIVRRLPPITDKRKKRILKIFQYLAKLKNMMQKKSPPPRSFKNIPQPNPPKSIENIPKPILPRSFVNIPQTPPPRSFENIPQPISPQIHPTDDTFIQQQTIHFGNEKHINYNVGRNIGYHTGQRTDYVPWKRPIQSYGNVDDYGTKRSTDYVPGSRAGYDSDYGYGFRGMKNAGYGRVKTYGYGNPKRYGFRGGKSYGHRGFRIHDSRELKSYGSRKFKPYEYKRRNSYGSGRKKGYGPTEQRHYGTEEDGFILPFWQWEQPWYPTQILQNGYFGKRRKRYNTYGRKKKIPYSKCRYCNLDFKTKELQQKSHFLSSPHLNSYDSGIGRGIKSSGTHSDYTTVGNHHSLIPEAPHSQYNTGSFYTDGNLSKVHGDWHYKRDAILTKRKQMYTKNIYDSIQKRRRLLNKKSVQINFKTGDTHDNHKDNDKMLNGYVHGRQTKGTRLAKTY